MMSQYSVKKPLEPHPDAREVEHCTLVKETSASRGRQDKAQKGTASAPAAPTHARHAAQGA